MSDRVVPALNSEQLKIGIEEMKARHGKPPWHEVLTENDRYRVVVICQAPGHPNDWHYHLADECWFATPWARASCAGTRARQLPTSEGRFCVSLPQ